MYLWECIHYVSVHLQAPYRQAQNNEDMQRYNNAISEVRVAVERFILRLNLKNYFKFVDFKKDIKLCLSPVGKTDSAFALLQKAHTCFNGNELAKFFGAQPLALKELSL